MASEGGCDDRREYDDLCNSVLRRQAEMAANIGQCNEVLP